ncbi:3-hydroxyacyl-ACP dehydratase [Maridesulfovibrio sp.]|uniref:3-hydroxyacyl-ACP dehydratase FabZ family protein n=1 Tax=Maridesulfovibrio sp. TaxID=2795000 RepID=UPI002A186C86|nr:3-hydroxyacyl-ACP dehydratase [Maridesulfovibrio sp.]
MELRQHIAACSGHLEQIGAGYRREFNFPESFPGFDGHFPGNPILPGVIQTLLGEICSFEALEKEYPGEKMRLETVTRGKFMRPVKPGEKLTLDLSLKTKDAKRISICTLRVYGETAASYQLIFVREEE